MRGISSPSSPIIASSPFLPCPLLASLARGDDARAALRGAVVHLDIRESRVGEPGPVLALAARLSLVVNAEKGEVHADRFGWRRAAVVDDMADDEQQAARCHRLADIGD